MNTVGMDTPARARAVKRSFGREITPPAAAPERPAFETVVFLRPAAYAAAPMRPVDLNGDGRRRSGLLLGLLLAGIACRAHGETAPASHQVEHGRELYGKMCAVCHGPTGEGYRADQAPRIAHPDFLSAVNDAYLRRAIAQGRPGTTMSAWATERGGPLSTATSTRWSSPSCAPGIGPPAHLDEHLLSGDPARGKQTYARRVRALPRRARRGGPQHPHRQSAVPARRDQRLPALRVRQGTLGHQHARLRDSLGHDGIEDVVALLRTFQLPAGLAEHLPPRPPRSRSAPCR